MKEQRIIKESGLYLYPEVEEPTYESVRPRPLKDALEIYNQWKESRIECSPELLAKYKEGDILTEGVDFEVKERWKPLPKEEVTSSGTVYQPVFLAYPILSDSKDLEEKNDVASEKFKTEAASEALKKTIIPKGLSARVQNGSVIVASDNTLSSDNCDAPFKANATIEQIRELVVKNMDATIKYESEVVLFPQRMQGRFGNTMSYKQALESYTFALINNIEKSLLNSDTTAHECDARKAK
jgi:hypothetical protein